MNIFIEAYAYKSVRYLIPVHVGMIMKALICLVKEKNKNKLSFWLSACPFNRKIIPKAVLFFSGFLSQYSSFMAGFLDNFQDHGLSESWNKLLEEGHWKDFTILVSDFIEVSRIFFCIFLTKRQPKTFIQKYRTILVYRAFKKYSARYTLPFNLKAPGKHLNI
jgi:hypothetical protein